MIQLLPYTSINGEYTLSDTVLRGFWDQLVEDGTATIIFSDGLIDNAEDFVKYAKTNSNLPVFAFIDKKIVGLAWLNSISGKHAFGHFAMLKNIWGKDTTEVGKEIIKYWFALPGVNGGPLFEVILGLVPTVNQRAIKYIQRIGFKTLGSIPSMLYSKADESYKPATLSFIER